MRSTQTIIIGTRGSPLALVQAKMVREALERELPEGPAVELRVIRTTGDRITDRPLLEVGGKGLFTKEIDESLLGGEIDCAVHSMKDLPTRLPEGTMIAATLPRADPRDVLIGGGADLASLPAGLVVGTASLRRQAQLLAIRPDLQVVNMRGNVETRLAKLERGEVGATLLAAAGLHRLGLWPDQAVMLSTAEMLPAVAQGAVGVACRTDDERLRGWLAGLDHHPTSVCVRAERAMLAVLDGSCRTPIAGYAQIAGERLRLAGLVAAPDGSNLTRLEQAGDPETPEGTGVELGTALLDHMAPGG